MKKMLSLLFAATIPLVTAAPLAAGQLSGPIGQRPIGQTGAGSRVAELAQQNVVTIICRGGPGLSIENRGISPNGSAARDTVTLLLSFRRVDRPAGPDGRGLDPGTCSSTHRALAPMDPTRIQFDLVANAQIQQALHDGRIDTSPTAAERYADAKTIQPYLADASHYWRFDVVRSGGYLAARSNQPVTASPMVAQDSAGTRPGPLGPGNAGMADRGNPIFAGGGGRPVPTTAAALPSNLLQMEDRAIIVIGGKQVAAGEVKRQILQSLPVSSTPPKRMSVPPRRAMPQLPSVSATTASASEPSSMLQRASGSLTDKRLDAANFDCSHGPTSVGLHSAIRAGEQIAVTGACFGSQPGAIELIGQFPGGSLRLTFLSWKDSEIIAAAPPVKGVPDQVAAFTIVRADGKRSTTRQVNFVAARERVEVPSSFWSPSNRLTWSAVGHDTLPDLPGPFLNGYPSTDFRLRINPACTLDAMETNSTMGEVIAITGWDGGSSPFEANVRVAWMSSTEKTTTKTTYLLGATSISELFVRRVDFTVRAWAYCPAGIVP